MSKFKAGDRVRIRSFSGVRECVRKGRRTADFVKDGVVLTLNREYWALVAREDD